MTIRSKLLPNSSPKSLEKFKRQAARKISQDARIPGFRPGKAPYDVVRRMYGEDAIQKEAIELMLDEVYPQVLKEAAVEPSGPGNLEEVISQDPPIFAFVVPLMPKVTLGEFHTIRKPYELPEVTESQVDDVIKNLRANYSTADPVERPAEEGDLVSLKIKGTLAEPAEGEDADIIPENTLQMIVGENEYEVDDWPFEGFTRELVGLPINETKTVVHSFPEDYVDEKFRGKTVSIEATVLSVKDLVLPELNDEFAQTLGEYPTLDALRASIRQSLEETNRREYENSYFSGLIDEISAVSEIHYPPHLLQEEMDQVVHSLEHDLEDRKMDMPTYLKTINKEKEAFLEEEIKPVAKRRLERSLLLDEVARAEGVKLDTNALQYQVASAMQSFQSDPEFSKLRGERAQQFAQNLTMETANRMLNQQVMDRLKAIATGEAEAQAESSEIEPALMEETTSPETAEPVSEAAPQEETTSSEPEPVEPASEPAPQEEATETGATGSETAEDKPEQP